MKGDTMTFSDDLQGGRHDVLRDECIVASCESLEAEQIIRERERADIARVAARPYRVIHEIPRKHTTNGYAFDV